MGIVTAVPPFSTSGEDVGTKKTLTANREDGAIGVLTQQNTDRLIGVSKTAFAAADRELGSAVRARDDGIYSATAVVVTTVTAAETGHPG